METEQIKFNAFSQILFFIIFIAALAINKGVILGIYFVLCIWALLGPKQAIQALALNYIILLLNPAICRLPEAAGILRWLVLLLAGFRVLPTASARMFRCLTSLFAFFVVALALSWLTSPKFDISLLKASVFTFCVATVLTAFSSFTPEELEKVKKWFFCLTAAVIIVSLPTIMIPKIGYKINGRGFQGIFNQPEAFGTFMAPFAAYLAASLLLKKGSKSLWLWSFALTAILMIFLSKARTGMLAVILSIGITFIANILQARVASSDLSIIGFILKTSAIIVTLIVLFSVSPVVSKNLSNFLFKGEKIKETTIGNEFYASRGKGVVFYWNRFLESPLTGNGFGIDAGHVKDSQTATFMGIPISATTEKGFLPVAFLEEVGIIGLIFFTPFFLTLIKGAMKSFDLGLISMFFACLFVNIGEAVFFSPGQTGGFLWLVIGLCTAKGMATRHEY